MSGLGWFLVGTFVGALAALAAAWVALSVYLSGGVRD